MLLQRQDKLLNNRKNLCDLVAKGALRKSVLALFYKWSPTKELQPFQTDTDSTRLTPQHVTPISTIRRSGSNSFFPISTLQAEKKILQRSHTAVGVSRTRQCLIGSCPSSPAISTSETTNQISFRMSIHQPQSSLSCEKSITC